MANYPQLDNTRGVWNIKEIYDAMMGGYWPNASGGRAIYVGGATPSNSDVIDFITMSSVGNATDFGNLTGAKNTFPGVCSSFTRGLIGDASSIDFITYATTGNAADFGDMSAARGYLAGLNSSTRGVFAGGADPSIKNVIDYVTMTSLGNAVDFGDLTVGRREPTNASSPTRGVICAGQNSPSSPYNSNTIDFLTIATTGNAIDFGDNTYAATQMGGCSSSTRGTFMAGQTPTYQNVIQYVEIASQGNAVDFGDLSAAKTSGQAASNSVKGIYAGGEVPGDSNPINVIEEFRIAVGGTVTDFGDLATARKNMGAGSNQNGGLNDGYQGTRPLPAGSGRALFGGGIQPASTNVIDFITMSTLGNAADFGNLRFNRYYHTAFASSIRFFSMAGVDGTGATAHTDDIEYVNFASQGNCSFFSDGTVTNRQMVGFSNATRGVSGGASSPYINVIEFVVLATVGTDGLDFGNLSSNRSYMGGFASPTRGVFVGGFAPGAQVNIMEYITIASTGDTTDFGDLTQTARNCAGMASETRGLRFSGESGGSFTNVIDYVTIASTGDAADFGDVTVARQDASTAASFTRGVGAGGQVPGYSNVMDYVTIATTGDAADFGDLTVSASHHEGSSDAHGGLA